MLSRQHMLQYAAEFLSRSTKYPESFVCFLEQCENTCLRGELMADVPTAEITHLEQLAATLQRRLRILETQAAGYGALAIPVHIVLQLEETRREYTRTMADLRRLRPRVVYERAPYLGLLTFQESDTDHFFGR